MRTGCPWRDLPECYGKWLTAYKRFNRWAAKGLWEAIFEVLCADVDFEWLMLDATVVRAHQHAAGAKGAEVVMPLKKNRVQPREHDAVLYKERNLVERLFNRLKQWRGVATRYAKLARNYLSAA